MTEINMIFITSPSIMRVYVRLFINPYMYKRSLEKVEREVKEKEEEVHYKLS